MGIVILLLSLLILVVSVFVFKTLNAKSESDENQKQIPDDCCGAHEVCEKDSLLALNGEIIYYDDEELDNLTNKKTYTDQELNLFKDVFYTLKEEDVAGWLRSLQLREIRLPEELRDEALLIVAERRGI